MYMQNKSDLQKRSTKLFECLVVLTEPSKRMVRIDLKQYKNKTLCVSVVPVHVSEYKSEVHISMNTNLLS